MAMVVLMKSDKFVTPVFKGDECLELRCQNGEICIYGTRAGLKKLARLMLKLAETRKCGHIHLEDRGLLTQRSLRGAVAIFQADEQ